VPTEIELTSNDNRRLDQYKRQGRVAGIDALLRPLILDERDAADLSAIGTGRSTAAQELATLMTPWKSVPPCRSA